MSKSDTVRKRLDERGIEHKNNDTPLNGVTSYMTTWHCANGKLVSFIETEIPRSTKLRIYNLTPEQAIAATVGNGTDLASRLREVTGLHAFAELFGFSWEDESDWDWHDVACAMADAIDATVGVGTCKPTEKRVKVSNTQEHVTYYCECGEELGGYSIAQIPWPHTYNEAKLPKHCPKCGRRVVTE